MCEEKDISIGLCVAISKLQPPQILIHVKWESDHSSRLKCCLFKAKTCVNSALLLKIKNSSTMYRGKKWGKSQAYRYIS